jgi:hypothetical protein
MGYDIGYFHMSIMLGLMAMSPDMAKLRYVKTATYINQFYYVYLHGIDLHLEDYARQCRTDQTDSSSTSKFLSICIKSGGFRTPSEGTQIS